MWQSEIFLQKAFDWRLKKYVLYPVVVLQFRLKNLLQTHCTKYVQYVFLETQLRHLIPKFCFSVSGKKIHNWWKELRESCLECRNTCSLFRDWEWGCANCLREYVHSCKMFNRVDWVDFGHIYLQLWKAQTPSGNQQSLQWIFSSLWAWNSNKDICIWYSSDLIYSV
jgi:hypothetical protein